MHKLQINKLTSLNAITLHIIDKDLGTPIKRWGLLYRCPSGDYLPGAITESLINRLKPYSKHIQLLKAQSSINRTSPNKQSNCTNSKLTINVTAIKCILQNTMSLTFSSLLSSGLVWGYRDYRTCNLLSSGLGSALPGLPSFRGRGQ